MQFRPGCRPVNPALVRKMENLATARTKEALNAQFGISYNTWRKLLAGEPVRASLAERLVSRIAELEQD